MFYINIKNDNILLVVFNSVLFLLMKIFYLICFFCVFFGYGNDVLEDI